MRDKQCILSEIRRTAASGCGRPLGQRAFLAATGINESEWKGVYWARWSDALAEAGFEPLEWNLAIVEADIFKVLADLVRKYKRYPVKADIQMEHRNNEAIPVPTTLRRRFGERSEVIRKLRDYCSSNEGYSDVLEILGQTEKDSLKTSTAVKPPRATKTQTISGYVYLVRSGKLYKIGCTENHWRRKSELHQQTSEGITEVHTISAIDDPKGIERYWHERFKEKRRNGEWFDLSSEEISAFKRRKFM